MLIITVYMFTITIMKYDIENNTNLKKNFFFIQHFFTRLLNLSKRDKSIIYAFNENRLCDRDKVMFTFTCPEIGIEKTTESCPNAVSAAMKRPCCLSDAQFEVTTPAIGIHAAKLTP